MMGDGDVDNVIIGLLDSVAFRPSSAWKEAASDLAGSLPGLSI